LTHVNFPKRERTSSSAGKKGPGVARRPAYLLENSDKKGQKDQKEKRCSYNDEMNVSVGQKKTDVSAESKRK